MTENTELNPEETAQEPHGEWALRRRREDMNVTRYQAKVALYQAGMLAQVQAYIDDTTDPVVKLAWEEASFKRQSDLVQAIGVELGLDGAGMDTLFDAAKGIE